MNSSEVDILLVDDSQEDVALTMHALRSENLANRVFVARDVRVLRSQHLK